MAESAPGTPFWLKLFLEVGFPTAVSALLIGTLLGWMPSPLMKKLEAIEYQTWQQGVVLRALCYKIAERDHLEKFRCEPWKKNEE